MERAESGERINNALQDKGVAIKIALFCIFRMRFGDFILRSLVNKE